MTVTTKIRRQGGAAVVTIPPALLKLMGTEVGSELALEIENGNLVATPVRGQKKRYSLAELLEGSDEMAELNSLQTTWDEAPATGKETF